LCTLQNNMCQSRASARKSAIPEDAFAAADMTMTTTSVGGSNGHHLFCVENQEKKKTTMRTPHSPISNKNKGNA
jgi:hypothetical protein